MNKPIRTLAIGCLVLFALLMLNVNYVQVFKAGELNDRSSNKRARDAECSRERGPILVDSADEDAIARSVASDDNLKFIRKYTRPAEYAPVTGFFSCIFGTTGVESSENSILSGSDPSLFVNRVIDLLGDNQPQGGSVLLTLDKDAQTAAYDGLKELPGSAEGAAVALDPDTGAILAMATLPSYNPNRIATHDYNAAVRSYKKLSNSPRKVMRNRAAQEIYPPGSTFKLVTAAAALSTGNYTPETLVKGGTGLQLPQTSHVLHNENGSNCGGDRISLTQALVVSCNVSFGSIGLELGADALKAQAEKFGFNEEYMDDLSMEPSVFPADLNEPNTALSAIGQFDVAATPLQMAMVAGAIANGGDVMKPYVVDQVRSPDLDVIRDTPQPEVLHQAISSDVASSLTQMMVDVVESGTGSDARIPGVTVAGKTGTANSAESRSPYAWMVTFAPADDPQVAVAVMVESTDVPRDDITGGGLAGPIARNIMKAVIDQ